MADIDLFRDAYRNNLGRDASDDELQGWVSGAYGGGSVQDRLNQIANSGEAQSYRAPTIGPSPGENTGYSPGGQAVPGSGFGDPSSGYGPGGVNNPAYTSGQANQNQITDWYQQYLGRGPQQSDISQWLSGAYGWGSAGNMSGIEQGIRGSAEARARGAQTATGTTGATTGTTGTTATTPGPQGGNYEAWLRQLWNGMTPTPENLEKLAPQLAQHGIRLGSKGNRGWTDTIILPDGRTYDVIEGAGINMGRNWVFSQNGGPGYVPSSPDSQYSDPHTQFMEKLLSQLIQMRMQPSNDPNRQMYEQMLKQRADSLGQGNKQLDQLMGYLQERFTDLQGNGYTGAEGEAIRTGALDPIETDRQAARKRVMERLSARGLSPDSGIAQQALLEVDKAFDAMRGTTQTALTTHDLNRREDRKQRAQTIGSQLVDIPQARAREQLDVFAALNQLSQLARQEDEARQREAAGYSGILSDLGPQRLQLAMSAAGMGGNPSSMFGNLMQLAGMNQNASAYGAQNQSSMWSGLGSIAAMLANSGR